MAAQRPNLRVEPLSADHDREGFSCGIDSLDRYLRTQASQDLRRKAKGVFILIEPTAPSTILGYYTLCATGLQQGDVPAAARRYVPRYPLVSATLVRHLAISVEKQGERLGGVLLADAVQRAYATASIVGSSMLVVDAVNERAAAFYEGNGFVRLPESMRLVLPMPLIGKMFKG